MSRLGKYILSEHAREEAARRNISLEIIDEIMMLPGQIVEVHSARKAYQSKVEIEGKLFIVRVIIEASDPPMITYQQN